MTDASGSLATTYSLIYTFLKGRSHEKAAAAVKKAAKDAGVIVLRDTVEEAEKEKDSLYEIIKSWKTKSEHETSTSSNLRTGILIRVAIASSESDSSDSLVLMHTIASSTSTSSISSHSNDLKLYLPRVLLAKSSKATTSSSSDSSSDESDSKSAKKKKKNTAKSKTAPVAAAKVEQNVKATKKRRLSESGQAVVTAVEEDIRSPSPNSKQNGKSQINDTSDNATPATPVNGNGHHKKPRKSNTPFQRIKAENIVFRDERLKDNTFLARGGADNDYGAKANQDLIVTRGEGFRKEKNKKKRGSYRGGEITVRINFCSF
ncbi:hypothetical protein Clacol_006550 [Clathrus columnatus]|uniref:Srp40 C-terminal domain-containing protein n=1 Tax=Clathrus columnatus TaxID=1419009 RepID=A0AAV5AHZ9_9AGAM|nr:hypothetical protein Clacol_006550 [Clathrus columnatus]